MYWQETSLAVEAQHQTVKVRIIMSHIANDTVMDSLIDWLEDHSVSSHDVMFDEDSGRGFILEQVENGTPGEDGYNVYFMRTYLPEQFQDLL